MKLGRSGPDKLPVSRCSVCDERFDGFLACREHIIDNHRSGFDVSGADEFQYRSDLTFGDLEWVDEQIWMMLPREDGTGYGWHQLSASYHRVFPFNMQTSNVRRGLMHTVYVAQCLPIEGSWRHVYVGSTNKEIESRYEQHIDPEANPIRGRYSRQTYLTKNRISKDPSKGLRWDLQYRIHDHDERICYPSREVSRQVEAWLHHQLAKLGYVVGGDIGVPLQIQ